MGLRKTATVNLQPHASGYSPNGDFLILSGSNQPLRRSNTCNRRERCQLEVPSISMKHIQNPTDMAGDFLWREGFLEKRFVWSLCDVLHTGVFVVTADKDHR